MLQKEMSEESFKISSKPHLEIGVLKAKTKILSHITEKLEIDNDESPRIESDIEECEEMQDEEGIKSPEDMMTDS